MRVQLKMAIMQAGMSQYALAAAVGVSETRLSRICRGRAQPTTQERELIAAALGRPEAELFQDARSSRSGLK